MDQHVLEDGRSRDGRRFSLVCLDESGRLVIRIHDLGGAFGEYESVETCSALQTQRLREKLGEDLIAAIAERFPSLAAFSKYRRSVGIGLGRVWNVIH